VQKVVRLHDRGYLSYFQMGRSTVDVHHLAAGETGTAVHPPGISPLRSRALIIGTILVRAIQTVAPILGTYKSCGLIPLS
jgi:hypothetical protein